MKKLLFILLLFICAVQSQAQYILAPVGNPRWFKDYIIFSDTVRFGDTATTHMRIMPGGKIYMLDNFILDNDVDSILCRDNITGEIKLRSMSNTLNAISFLDLNDTPDDYTGHHNELAFITGDEDSIIFSTGLQWDLDALPDGLLILSDDLNSGFGHMSKDFSKYARFSYFNIGMTDGVDAMNIYPGSISVKEFHGANYFVIPGGAWDGYTKIIQAGTDNIITWTLPTSNSSGYFKNDGSGGMSWDALTGADIGGFTQYDVPNADASGYLQTSGLHFNGTLYNLYYGTTNSESYNLNVTEPTGRCEAVFTGYATENILKIRYANGTQSSPTTVLAGDAFGVYGFSGYDGTSYTSDVDGGMKMIATENWTTGAHGNYMLFAIKATGSNTLTKQMRVDENGVNIGAFGSHTYKLDVNGDVNIATGSNYKINGTNISTTNVSEGSNQYYTGERVDDRVDALIVAGTNMSKSYNDAGDALTLNASYKTIVGGNVSSVVGASTTTYAPIFSQTNFSATESQRQMIMPFAGTASMLYFVLGTNQPASGNMVVTVRKNGVATALTFTIAANASAATFSDVTHSFTFVAGDKLSIECVNNATGNSGGVLSYSFMVQ